MPVRRLLLLSAVLACATAAAQTAEPPKHGGPIVYKCVNADGSVVYSESACSTDPAKVKTIDTSPALRTGSGGHVGEIAASVADSDCRDRAFKSTHADAGQIAESNRHIADYERRKQELQSQPAYAVGTAPAAGDATPAPAADNAKALADLDASIAAEREFQAKASANNETAYQAALRACDDELRKNSQPAPAPPKPAAPPASGTKEGGG